MTKERRKISPWYKKALQNSIVPLIVAALTVWVTLDRVEARLGNHIDDENVHMTYERKTEKFIPRPEHELAIETINEKFDRVDRRFDKLDDMQIKIYDKINERRQK